MNKAIVTALAAVHLAATAWHGSAHDRLAVGLSPGQTAFVILVILVAPALGGLLVWTPYARAGVWLFTVSMLAAFLFGVYHHYVLVSPDNVHHLPAGTPNERSAFVVSAALIACLELASTVYGAFRLRALHAVGGPP